VDSYNGYGQRGSFHVIEHQMAAAVELFPIFARAHVLRTWGGIVDTTLDARFVPSAPAAIFDALQVAQRWSLFAPIPARAEREFVINAALEDGTHASLLGQWPTTLIRVNDDGYGIVFPSLRWQNYFLNLEAMANSELAALGEFLCRRVAATAGLANPETIEIASFVRAVGTAWSDPRIAAVHHLHTCAPP